MKRIGNIPLAVLLLLLLATGCNSPLDIDTPRNEFRDGIDGTISVDFPPDDTTTIINFSVSMIFDASESMSGLSNEETKNAGHAFIDSMDGIRDEGAVVWFTENVTVFEHITSDRQDLHDAVELLPAGGATAMWDGLYTGLLEINARGGHVRRAVILVADDADNSSTFGTPEKILNLALDQDIAVYTIALRLTPEESTLAAIADSTGGRHWSRPYATEMTDIFLTIFELLRAK